MFDQSTTYKKKRTIYKQTPESFLLMSKIQEQHRNDKTIKRNKKQGSIFLLVFHSNTHLTDAECFDYISLLNWNYLFMG
jgi:hypothetical protein